MSPRRALAVVRATLLALGSLAAAAGRAQAPDWSVDPAAFERSLNVVGAVRAADGAPVPLPTTARVAAFVGDAVRGVAAPVAVGAEQRFFLTAYGAAGETLTFRLYDGAAVAALAEPAPFAADAVRGTVAAPFVWTAGTGSGGGGGGGAGGPRWRVDPKAFDRSMGVVAAVRLAGGTRSTSPTDTVAAFVGGEVRGVAAAVPTAAGPVFFLTVYGRAEGEPVAFRVASGGQATAAAPDAPVAFASDGVVGATGAPLGLTISAGTSPAGSDDPATWAVEPAGFEHALSVVGALTVGGVPATHPADRVAAFVGGEVRGVAAPALVGGRPLFFLTVHGRAGEAVVVKAYDGLAGQTRGVDGPFAFVPDAVRGTLAAPVVFRATGPAGTAPPDDPAAWAADPAAFEATMSAVGTVDGAAPHPSSRVAVLAGDAPRGVAAPVTAGGRALYFLTAHGVRAGEALRLVHFDGATGRVYEDAAPFAFVPDAVRGTLTAPVVWTRPADPTALYVYPGDANGDGTADQNDLLPLALYFGLAGPARAAAAPAFAAALVRAWAPVAAASADADGNGTVDQNDLLPLGLYFGRARPADPWPAPAAPVAAPAAKTAGTLRLAAAPTAARVAPGDTLAVLVRADGAEGAYGVGVRLAFDPAAFDVLGATDGDLFAAARADGAALRFFRAAPGTAGYAATRTAPGPVAPAGTLVRVRLRVRAGAAPGVYPLALADPAARTPDGARLPVEAAPAAVEVARTVGVDRPEAGGLGLDAPRPQPARGPVVVPFRLGAAAPVWLDVVDALGRRVRTVLDGAPLPAGAHTAALDAAGLAPGVYVVRLRADADGRARPLVVR